MNANSTTAPGIVDADRNPILVRSEVYSGVYGRASINFYAFNSNGNRGIASTCRAVLHALTVFLCVLAFHIDRKPDNDSPDNADKQIHRVKTRQGI